MGVGKLSRQGNMLQIENVPDPKILFIEEFSLIHHFHEQKNPNSVFSWIDKIKACGANGMRTVGFYVWDEGHEEEPFLKSGNQYNLHQFNEPFFDYMKRWVKYADDKGIVIIYDIFDRCLFSDWAGKYAQFNPFYPLLDHLVKTNEKYHNLHINAFTDFGNTSLFDIQKNYVRKVVETIKNLNVANVILGVMNEFEGGDEEWYHKMARYIKEELNWPHLLAGSGQSAMSDPRVDMWFVHKGMYANNRESCIEGDINALRQNAGGEKILGYSMDGFPELDPNSSNHADFLAWSPENAQQPNFPQKLRDLAQAAVNKGLQLFGYMDHCASRWLDDPITGTLRPLNEAGYRAVAEVFNPQPLPNGMLYVFQARRLESPHPQAVDGKGGKAIPATTTKGDLFVSPTICHSEEKPFLPDKPLTVYFSLLIDDNAKGNANIATAEVCDAATDAILAEMVIQRKQFATANDFTLFKLTFTPSKESKLLFRVHYLGKAYLAINKMALVDPAQLTLKDPKEIPDNVHSTTPLDSDNGQTDNKDGMLYSYPLSQCQYCNHPDVFLDKGGKAIRATTTKGFLAFGPYATGYPVKPLEVYFSVFIDNNTFDNAKILTLDVYDAENKEHLVKETPITRKQFPVAGDFSLFKLSFTPKANSKLEFRIFYEGYAYVAADWIVVTDPAKLKQINNHNKLLKLVQSNGIDDPLTNKTTKATQIVGGEFTAEGYKITGKVNSYLRYDTNITGAIRVTFDAKGFIPGEPMYGTNDQGSILVMQDVPHGTNWVNWKTIDGFLFQLLKMAKYDSDDKLKLKAGSYARVPSFLGEWKTPHPLSWDSSKTYHWDIAFEPESLEIKRDEQLIFKNWIDPLVFGKKNQPIVVYIGGDDGANNISPNNVTYSNVKIYRK